MNIFIYITTSIKLSKTFTNNSFLLCYILLINSYITSIFNFSKSFKRITISNIIVKNILYDRISFNKSVYTSFCKLIFSLFYNRINISSNTFRSIVKFNRFTIFSNNIYTKMFFNSINTQFCIVVIIDIKTFNKFLYILSFFKDITIFIN